MAKKTLLILLALPLIIIALALIKPDHFSVTRSLLIQAPPEKIFANVNDLKLWKAWSPWGKKDPEAQVIAQGSPGVGSILIWSGSWQVGAGQMSITGSRPYESITLQLRFEKPFASEAQSVFNLEQVPKGTQVHWTLAGKNNFVAKLISVFINREQSIGNDCEQGLQALKKIVEAP